MNTSEVGTWEIFLWSIPSCVRHDIYFEWAVFLDGKYMGRVPSEHQERELAEADDDERTAALELIQWSYEEATKDDVQAED